jgi:ElaB/YqjD/DUF883 family membrane-anchored ribosome-binding protein
MELSPAPGTYLRKGLPQSRSKFMSTSSTATHNLRDAANDTAKEAREGARDFGKAASDASGNIQDDLQALREDFSQLAEQFRDILSTRGGAAWQRAKAQAKSSIDGAVSDARDTGRDAAGAVRDISDNVVEAIDDSLKTRPYMTLAVVAGLGFLFGALWRR